MNDRESDSLIADFIRRYTEPVLWIGWWLDATEPTASEALRSALCEPGGEVLRDLTQPSVREAVICAVLGTETLSRSVGAEAERFLDRVAGLASR